MDSTRTLFDVHRHTTLMLRQAADDRSSFCLYLFVLSDPQSHLFSTTPVRKPLCGTSPSKGAAENNVKVVLCDCEVKAMCFLRKCKQ